MRIDKLLSNLAYGSRKEIHSLLKTRAVAVNGVAVTAKEHSVDPDKDIITVHEEVVETTTTYYLKYNKPPGLITAMEDKNGITIMDTLPERFKKLGVTPVGRLDKDTSGLLFLSNDGKWAHRVINGKKDIPKTYRATYEGHLTESGKQRIAEGLLLGDGTLCKPAQLTIVTEAINSEGVESGTCLLTIIEGKYHQVKRMIGAAGGTVIELVRLSIGPVTLQEIDENGAYQPLTAEEIAFF